MTTLRSLLINKQGTPKFLLVLPPENAVSYDGPCGVFIHDRFLDTAVWRPLSPEEEVGLRNDVWEWASPVLHCTERSGARRYLTLEGARTIRRFNWSGGSWFEIAPREKLGLSAWLVAVTDHLAPRPGCSSKPDAQGYAGIDIGRPW